MTILCADPALCFSDALGTTFINPSSRLALKAWCSIDDGDIIDLHLAIDIKMLCPKTGAKITEII